MPRVCGILDSQDIHLSQSTSSDAAKPKLAFYTRTWGIDWLQWYSVDMHYLFNGQYRIHPNTDDFYFWSRTGEYPPEGLKALPLEAVLERDYSPAGCALFKMREDANPGALIKRTP